MLSTIVGHHLARPEAATAFTLDLDASQIAAISAKLTNPQTAGRYHDLIERADLQPGEITVQLDKAVLSALLGCAPDHINAEELVVQAPFQMRRRDVELKLHLGDTPSEINKTLVRNIMKARRWLAMVVEGQTIAHIAHAERLSNRRVQDLIPLVFLPPDLLEAIATGEQPLDLTTDYLVKTGFPTVWSEQRAQFAAL